MSNEQKPKQFRVEVVTAWTRGAEWEQCFARGIEAAYQKLNDEALQEGMIIVDQRQALTDTAEGLCMTITSQRISRKDLEAERFRQHFLTSAPERKPS